MRYDFRKAEIARVLGRWVSPYGNVTELLNSTMMYLDSISRSIYSYTYFLLNLQVPSMQVSMLSYVYWQLRSIIVHQLCFNILLLIYNFSYRWGILFSHPGDFTPVCTTELGAIASLIPEFTKRNIKCIALSCDPVNSHHNWIKDIQAYNKLPSGDFPFPIISDPGRDTAIKLGMLDPNEKDKAGLPLAARAVSRILPIVYHLFSISCCRFLSQDQTRSSSYLFCILLLLDVILSKFCILVLTHCVCDLVKYCESLTHSS